MFVPRALSLLGRLRLWAQIRRVLRSMRTVKGAALLLFGLLLVGMPTISRMMNPPLPVEGRLDLFRQFGPWGLAGILVATLLLSSAEGAVGFSAAEVNFLFSAPFTRRQLLIYKMRGFVTLSALTGMVLIGSVRVFGVDIWYPAAFLGLTLMFLFVQLAHLVAVLLACTLGAHVYTLSRRIVVAGLAACLLVLGIQAGAAVAADGWTALASGAADTGVGQVLLFPMRSFIELTAAQHLWPDLLGWLGCCLGFVAACVWLALALDAHYLELSAEASEKVYARQQLLRQGLQAAPVRGVAQRSVPGLPNWGGMGPLLWRQLSTAWRCRASVLRLILVLALVCVFSQGVLAMPAPLLLGIFMVWTAFMAPWFLPFDFRSDIDRFEFLKTLPLSPTRIALAQILVPPLLVTVLHWLFLGAILLWRQEFDPLILLAIALVPAGNVLLFAMENLLFLWYPNRLMAAQGDFQQKPRIMVFMFAKTVCLQILLLPAAIVGAVLYLLTRNAVLTALGAGLVIVATDVLLVILVGVYFRRFDVTRDVPA